MKPAGMSLLDWLKSEKGKSSMEEFVASLKIKEQNKLVNIQRIKKFFKNKEQFNILMERIIKKHDDRWIDLCYSNGCEPYPWFILEIIHDLVIKDGKEYTKKLDDFTSDFPSSIHEYKGWQFAITHGQGSVLSVYDNKVLKLRL